MPSIKYTLLVLVFAFSYEIQGQDSISIGSWESFLPYTTGNYLSQSEDKIIYSTKWSLFTIDKTDYSIELFDKINLLSDVGINKHQYDELTGQLIVAYDDSNIDIVRGSEVINIPDIRNNTSIIGDKEIYNMHCDGAGVLYLSCGFGLVEFDLNSYEFGFTCFTGIPVYQTIKFNDYLIAATEDGLYLYDAQKHNNPSDFQLWEHMGEAYGLPEIYRSKDLVSWNDQVYMVTENFLFKADDELNFQVIYQTDDFSEISFLNQANNNLLLGVSWEYNQAKVLFFDEQDQFIQSHPECSNRINYAVLDEEDRIWFADKIGNIRYAESKVYPCKSITINSPYSNNVSDISTKGEGLFIASGGVDASYKTLLRRDGFFIWDGDKWRNYNENYFDFFLENEIYDLFKVEAHPLENKIFVGSYFAGLIELDLETDAMMLYDDTNSTLQGKTGDPLRDRVSGLAFDEDNNLWISNFGAPKPISVYSADGEWTAFDVQSGKDLRDVSIDNNNYKWFIIDREAEGLLIYDSGDDLSSTADDRQRIVSKSNSELQSNEVNAIEVDLDGDVWVGTEDGFVVFDCGSTAIESSCKGSRRTTSLDGFGAYVLDDVNIKCIETDGANRKWLGTENGIFVLSSSGTEQVHHFTKSNSPLFDNIIIDLAYNPDNGSMFIATAKGVMAYRTKTSEGGEKHSSNIYAYPNPVREDYRGPIAIKGFARDSNIKITDINGQLIHESTSYGGQAIWDGYDYNGRRAASGVYLVFASTTGAFEEPDAVVTKILVINGE
jgi:hypothetical protein